MCAVIAIVLEIGLGLALLLGIKVRWTAILLAIFTVVITLIFHNYWMVAEAQYNVQRQLFNKNLAVVGGLLIIVVYGAGLFSVDAWRKKTLS